MSWERMRVVMTRRMNWKTAEEAVVVPVIDVEPVAAHPSSSSLTEPGFAREMRD